MWGPSGWFKVSSHEPRCSRFPTPGLRSPARCSPVCVRPAWTRAPCAPSPRPARGLTRASPGQGDGSKVNPSLGAFPHPLRPRVASRPRAPGRPGPAPAYPTDVRGPPLPPHKGSGPLASISSWGGGVVKAAPSRCPPLSGPANPQLLDHGLCWAGTREPALAIRVRFLYFSLPEPPQAHPPASPTGLPPGRDWLFEALLPGKGPKPR